jgi:FkbM family methyltransferase
VTLLRSAPQRLWKLLDRLGLDGYVRRGYFTLRAAPRGWRYRTRVGDASAELATSTWFEYKRAKRLHGERAVLEALLSDIADDEVFWDVGANVGVYSCLVADVLRSGTVVGFEPEPENRARLRTNLAANAPDSQWVVSSVALSDRDGTGRLAPGFPEEYRQVGAGHYYLSETEGRPVDCRRAETLIEDGIPAPDVLKIDVQGAELDVLRGFGEALGAVDRVYAELHTEKARRYDATVEETERFLREAGYSLTHLGEPSGYRGGVYHVRAAR